MHEQELVDSTIRNLIRLTGGRMPQSVEIALGPGVDAHEAEIAWKSITDGTTLGDIHVTWEQAFDLLVCTGDGHRFTEMTDTCPYCGADGVVVEAAPPIAIVNWEMNAT